jgi:AcrR family transcriptional regulator
VPASEPATNGIPKRRRLRGPERREQILEAARPLFLEAGLSGTRTRDVAIAAGVTEALLYQHFASKEELFNEAIIAPLQRTVDRLARSKPFSEFDETGRPQRVATEDFMRALLTTFIESVSLFGVVLFADRTVGARFYNEQMAPLLDQITDTIRDNLSGWPHRDFDPRLAIVATFGMCWSAAIDSRYRDDPLDIPEVAKQLTDLLFLGVYGLGDPFVPPTKKPIKKITKPATRKAAPRRGR